MAEDTVSTARRGVEARAAACVASGRPGDRDRGVGDGRQRRGTEAGQGADQPAGAAAAAAAAPNAGGLGLAGHRVRARLAVTGLFALVGVAIRNAAHGGRCRPRNQRFVDTATQTVVNMFSYNQNSIDESVNRFVNSTSGPLRDMMSQPGNVDNLKALFRDTNASSEAVINGAALEGRSTRSRRTRRCWCRCG